MLTGYLASNERSRTRIIKHTLLICRSIYVNLNTYPYIFISIVSFVIMTHLKTVYTYIPAIYLDSF